MSDETEKFALSIKAYCDDLKKDFPSITMRHVKPIDPLRDCTCDAIRAGFDDTPIPEGMHHSDCPVTNERPDLAYYGEDE